MNNSKRRRLEREQGRHQRGRSSHAGAEVGYVTVTAWAASEAELPTARKQTHDILVTGLGDRRRSGVSWRIAAGPEALSALGAMLDGAMPEQAAVYRRVLTLLQDHGGWVVVAMARATR